ATRNTPVAAAPPPAIAPARPTTQGVFAESYSLRLALVVATVFVLRESEARLASMSISAVPPLRTPAPPPTSAKPSVREGALEGKLSPRGAGPPPTAGSGGSGSRAEAEATGTGATGDAASSGTSTETVRPGI